MNTDLVEDKKKSEKKAINITQTLVIRPPQRSSVGIGKLQSAIKSADRGRRERLYDLYGELLRDPVLSNAIERRIMAITNTEILFQKEDKEVEEMAELIESHEFEETIAEIIRAKLFGKTVLELDFTNGYKVYSIPRKHLNTETKEILRNISDVTGYPYENDDFLLNIGKDDDLGVILTVAPFAIYKREGTGDFAQFVELFGIDTLVGYYDPDDENGRQEMETSMKERGSGASVTMSKNSKIETVGTSRQGQVDIHDRFLAKCDEQILIGILGQTMTTKDGSSLSQSKTHAQTEDDINQADRRFVQRVLNQELLPRLAKRGYPVEGGKFVFAEKGENLTKKEQLEIAEKVNSLTENGVDEGYFFETFGLPKAKGEKSHPNPPKGREQEPNEEEEQEEPQEPADKNKKQKTENQEPKAKSQKRKAKNLSLFDRIKDFFGDAPK